ncbi:hypothetical protein DMH04_18245 [Kibdelosporangium aridum]|uniref:Cytochrome C biogenesis protein transmembrane domain-containing protein n=1 Tax=Kibdelosporangium aridum TaxID=2030 RepID=A0A428ZB24_KIBAR|nr:hypothetical protein DMH04_18245 [Kibdelosporangium aridum]
MMDLDTLGFALVAGMVATVNPCGFAMLPAYLTLVVTGDNRRRCPRCCGPGRAVHRLTACTSCARFTAVARQRIRSWMRRERCRQCCRRGSIRSDRTRSAPARPR